jgi:hypothetical protein
MTSVEAASVAAEVAIICNTAAAGAKALMKVRRVRWCVRAAAELEKYRCGTTSQVLSHE